MSLFPHASAWCVGRSLQGSFSNEWLSGGAHILHIKAMCLVTCRCIPVHDRTFLSLFSQPPPHPSTHSSSFLSVLLPHHSQDSKTTWSSVLVLHMFNGSPQSSELCESRGGRHSPKSVGGCVRLTEPAGRSKLGRKSRQQAKRVRLYSGLSKLERENFW